MLPLIDQAKKPFFYPLDGEDKTCLPGGGTNPLVFGLGDTPQQRLSRFVPTIVEQAGKDWYFIGNDYVFPRSVNAVAIPFLKDAGGSVVAEEYVPLGTSDYRPVSTRSPTRAPRWSFRRRSVPTASPSPNRLERVVFSIV